MSIMSTLEAEGLVEEPVTLVHSDDSTPEPKTYKTYEDFDFSKLQQYAGLDCIVTSELLAKLWPKVIERPEFKVPDPTDPNGKRQVVTRAPAILKSVEDFGQKVWDFIVDLEINGFAYDVDENRRIGKRMVAEVAELEDRIFSQVGKKLDFNSSDSITKFLYEDRGFTPPSMTKSGAPSTDGAALLMLAGLDPMGSVYTAKDPELQFLADMAKRKDINSVYNTFIRTYVEDFVKRDGRIHPRYNLHGTSSFRISGEDPNLTQLPRPKHGYNVRDCYNVESGKVLILADWSSAECKFLASLANDSNMIDSILAGLDFHSYSASQMNGIPYEVFVATLEDKSNPLSKEYKRMRQNAKALTFGILYGSSVNGIAMNLNISKEEAEKLIRMYFDAYPKVEEYVRNSHRMAEWNQFVTTPFGQRKQEYGASSIFRGTAAYNAALRNSQNVRIQSTTSTAGLITFSECAAGVQQFGARAICTVYDSIEIEAPIESAASVIDAVKYYMDDWPLENFNWLKTKVGVEIEVGTNWGNATVVHPGTPQAEIEAIIQKLQAAKVQR